MGEPISTTGWIIIGATVVSATTTAVSANMNQNAQQAAKRAQREQTRLEKIQRQAEARERYRQLRRERAAALQVGEDLGAAESTSARSNINAIQTAGNIAQGFSSVTGQIANRMNAYSDKAASYRMKAGMWDAASSISSSVGSIAGYAGGYENLKNVFGSTGTTSPRLPKP